MTRGPSLAALLAIAGALHAAPSRAADDVAALQAELQALKSEYATRIGALEERLARLEAPGGTAAVAAQPAPPEPPAAPAPAAAASGAAAFNPAIALILAGTYAGVSQNPATWHLAGFIPSGGDTGPGERNFSLGESELTLGASVDPYFSGNLTVALAADDTVHVEEAWFRTQALGYGLSLKGGRFFSGIGYLNEVHAHAWDFVDQPLVYQAFFGGQLAQDGVQLKWLAPTDLFLEFGAETGSGQSFPGTRLDRNGPNGYALFAHVGGDLGDSASWRAGASWLDQSAADRAYQDVDAAGVPVVNAFTGRSRTWGVDALLKWAPEGNAQRQQLKVQGEYLRRRESGQLAFDTTGTGVSDAYTSDQWGWYLQAVFQFLPRWRLGLRYDALDSGSVDIGLVTSGALTAADFPLLRSAAPGRVTTMLDWNPSEFSRLRAQFAWDDARDGGPTDHQLFLQYLFSIGAHGAHKF